METYGLEKLGLVNAGAVYRNLTPAQLVEHALRRGEGTLSNTGALVVKTGKYTGRSANDKFIVDTPAVHDDIAWGKVNRPFEKAKFDAIRAKVLAYLQGRDVFIFDGFAGADPKYTKAFRIVNELASQNLFIHQLLRRPTADQLKDFHEDYTIIAAPGFKCVPDIDGTRSEAAILVDYEAREVVICGTQYAGEIKKSVFSVMNYVLPKQGVFPMHCSANIGKNGDSAVFFGLSGTGKTTLSADPQRMLIGDDEHGWADDSVFNFEGGCYAKCINLSPEGEPEIYNAIRFGALVENVVMDPDTREFDFDDASLAVNSRVGYPVEYIPNAELSGMSPSVPKTVIFLTADAYGVLPPISKLNKDHVLLRIRLHLQGGGHGDRRHRAGAHLLHLLRRAVPAAGPLRVRRHAGGEGREGRRQGVSGEHRLERHRQADEAQLHPGHGDGGPHRRHRKGRIRHGPHLRRAGAHQHRGRALGAADPRQHLGGQGGLRGQLQEAGAELCGEFQEVHPHERGGGGRGPQGVRK